MTKRFFFLCAAFSAVIFFSACSNDVLPSPGSGAGGTSRSVSAPASVTASNGEKRKITLEWTAVENAVRYFVYSSSTPFDSFTRIGESSTLSFTYAVSSGTSLYFRVTAVDYSGGESGVSSTVYGTSLAQPLISAIEGTAGSEDSSVTVYWFMANVTSETYLSSVRYTVICTDSTGVVKGTGTVSGADTSATEYTFSNLTPNSSYLYTVESYLVNSQGDTEKSDTVDAATARRMRPDAPAECKATEGTLTDGIELSFKLPEMVDVSVSGAYQQYPLYFKVYRRAAAAEGGTAAEWSLLIDHLYYSGVTVAPYTTADQKSAYYAAYVSGSDVKYKDTAEITRGVKYEYKVQSYADNILRVISSDLSAAETAGWAMAVPSFRSGAVVFTANAAGTAYESGSLAFTFIWDNLGAESAYTYTLHEKHFKLEKDNAGVSDTTGTETTKDFASAADINAYTRTFLALAEKADDRGYYKYSLDIKDASGTVVVTLTDVGRKLASDDMTLPEISTFTVAGGYKDKFVLTWNYNDTYTYALSYVPVSADGTKGDEVAVEAAAAGGEISTDGKTYSYSDSASSGDRRIYTLSAILGVSVEKTADVAETLGTPVPVFNTASYNSITVEWKKAQQASDYTIAWKYADTAVTGSGTQDLVSADLTPDANGYVNYTFTEPEGYTDASVSGKPVTVTLTAKSAVDTVSADVTAYTMGPAVTAVSATKDESSVTITVTWNQTGLAAGYIVKRDRCSAPDGASVLSTDVYYVSGTPTNLKGDVDVTVNSEAVDDSVKAALSGGKIILTDSYTAEPSGASTWQSNQDKIAWGFPYHYTVYPVCKTDDTLEEQSDSTWKLADTVTYTNTDKIYDTGAVLGYGLDVQATKSESPTNITITWTKPYIPSGKTYEPVLWQTESGTDNWKSVNLALDASGNKFVYVPTGTDRVQPFDFAVKYQATNELPHATYTTAMSKALDSYNEAENKGYAFAIDCVAENVTSDNISTYKERFRWNSLWDYTVRARGPETDYHIYILNKDYNSEKQKIAEINKTTNAIELNNISAYELTMTSAERSFILEPNNMTSVDSVHTGLLKVLREYEHEYTVEATRVNTAGTTINISYTDTDALKAYRQITPEEFAITTALSLATSMYSGIVTPVSYDTAYNRRYTYNETLCTLYKITGELLGGTVGVGAIPFIYGAERTGIIIGFIPTGTTNKDCTLTFKSKGTVSAYSGTVVINGMESGSGTYKVTYNGTTKDYRSVASGPFSYGGYSYTDCTGYDWSNSGWIK